MELAQAYFLLKSLKDNIPNHHEVDQHWVDDFHGLLDSIEKETGTSLSAFRVNQGELHHPVVAVTPGFARHGRIVQGRVHRGSSIVVERTRLMHKLDAVLSYFEFKQGATEPDKHIGFRG